MVVWDSPTNAQNHKICVQIGLVIFFVSLVLSEARNVCRKDIFRKKTRNKTKQHRRRQRWWIKLNADKLRRFSGFKNQKTYAICILLHFCLHRDFGLPETGPPMYRLMSRVSASAHAGVVSSKPEACTNPPRSVPTGGSAPRSSYFCE